MTSSFAAEPVRVHVGRLVLLVLVFAFKVGAQERQYLLGPTIDLIGGSVTNPNALGVVPRPASRPMAVFYALYPSVSLASTGGRSALNASYVFGLGGIRDNAGSKSESHSASFDFSRPPLGSKWSVSLSDSFLDSSDAATFNALRGVTPAAEGFRFLFDPVALRRSIRTENQSGITTGYSLSAKSTVSFSASHTLRNYRETLPRRSPAGGSGHAFLGGVDYTLRTTARAAWSVGYTGAYFYFKDFANGSSDTVHVGYSAGIAPNLTVQLAVGATRLGSQATGGIHLGYNTSVLLRRASPDYSFSLYYRQDTGDPVQESRFADTRQAGVAISREKGSVMLFLDASVFDARGSFNNHLVARGVSAAGSMGVPLTETLSVNWGGLYQRDVGFTEKRLFVSLKYRDPKRWRFF